MYDLDHPVIETQFLIASNEISRISTIVKDRVFMRKTGVIFYGPARLGKSQCCKALKGYLMATFPKLYVNSVTVINREGLNCSNIIRQLADIENCPIKSRETRLSIFKKLTDRIVLRVRENDCNQYVCLIDEFQRLRSADLYQLADLYNSLDNVGIKMTVVSFAMPEVIQLRDDLFASEQRQIIARFMSEFIVFKGCSSIDDFTIILKGYDSIAEYPPGSRITFTQAFAPIAFSSGFRLEKYAKPIWLALTGCAIGSYRNNLPMEHVLFSIKYILMWCSSHDRDGLVLTDTQIMAGVESSSLQDFCTYSGKSKVA